MRLKQIRLSGFKSFVDPTVLDVPGQLIGVVGPNGCGKSNIMDAVRWVLGESRANELRGESMQDVIFSGSSDRKPAARASVELVFDNAMGRIGGSWGVFTEVSVKRVLSRDGQSTYSINQQTVRRRDVHDLFSGTGLGPKAYAMIGQGTISRIIESKPEELRIFLEEAAGISRYKERRRETENRLADTRENLSRVEDILGELETQLRRLEAQAEQAERFQSLDAERQQFQGLVWLSKRQDALEQQHRASEIHRDFELRLDEGLALLRASEARLETARAAASQAGGDLHVAQAEYYKTHSDVAKFESDIRLIEESRRQTQSQLRSLAEQHQRHALECDQARQTISDASQRLDALKVSVQDQSERVRQLAEQQSSHESLVSDAQDRLESARSQIEARRRVCDAAGIRRQTAQDQRRKLEDHLVRHQRMLANLPAISAETLDDQELKWRAASKTELESGEAVSSLEWKSRQADEARAAALDAFRAAQIRCAELEAKLDALRQLEASLGDQSKIQPWLQALGWHSQQHFWQGIEVEAGWDPAIEAALREKLDAIAIAALDRLTAVSNAPPPKKQVFFQEVSLEPRSAVPLGAVPRSAAPATKRSQDLCLSNHLPGLRALRSLVKSEDEQRSELLDHWLAYAYVAENLEQALALQAQMDKGQRVFTAQGHCVEKHTVSFHAADQAHEGRLARLREADELQKALSVQHVLCEEAAERFRTTERLSQELSEQLVKARQDHLLATRALAQASIDTERVKQAHQQVEAERRRLEQSIAELELDIERQRQLELQGTEQIDTLENALSDSQQGLTIAQQTQAQAQQALSQWREGLHEAERQLDAYHYEFNSFSAKLEHAQQRCDVLVALLRTNAQQQDMLEEQMDEFRDDVLREQLQAALSLRLLAESGLAQCREHNDQMNLQVRRLEEERMRTEHSIGPLRENLAAAALESQAAKTIAEQFGQLLLEAGVDEQALWQLSKKQEIALKTASLQAALQSISQAIERLGPVNLAALDELSHARERKAFLHAQSTDLADAVQTLEDAIRKIDHETRDLLRQTYDQVNLNFGRFFPKLFGGGDAKLLLTGQEILDAGIQVMAHPPGKRNSSIHLLSGGEKALTAIALVFSIFQLNPAPFCLLDEVDSPLDDANTERYCDMVRAMSGQTQFLFITHNKLAMELAQQLVGVTMQERGVSRLVAVDLESPGEPTQSAWQRNWS